MFFHRKRKIASSGTFKGMLTAAQLVWAAHKDIRQSYINIEDAGVVVLPLEGQEAQIGPRVIYQF